MELNRFTFFLFGILAGSALIGHATENSELNFTQPAPEQALKNAVCHDRLAELLTQWKSSNQWVRRVPGDSGEIVFETPTERIGFWIRVSIPAQTPGEKSAPRAVLIAPDGDVGVSWTALDCVPKLALQMKDRPDPDLPDPEDSFTDASLAEQFHKHKAGIIYAWSPQMPLSIAGLNEAKKVAEKLHLAFIPVLDPMTELKGAQAAAKDYSFDVGYRKIASVELLERGMNLHYPSILFFSEGKFVGPMLPGYWDDQKALEAAIKGAIR